ncbi:hypothetical protein [Desulfoplanes formicivorans]|uniref:Uncharacterized protein n=1 Tax=Desulfoplanes formicivorans TaxID=1592317 RepID=A0A194ADF2_9BACT|nr:hypothetical protein [Desulfoplanes formicivorans]GAU08117.1 hypothetical protein DPF_0820 [Desulfoplanes formicivorans]
MVSQEIRSCAIALGSIMHQVRPEQAAVLRLVRQNLAVAADEAEEMEGLFPVPRMAESIPGDEEITEEMAKTA